MMASSVNLMPCAWGPSRSPGRSWQRLPLLLVCTWVWCGCWGGGPRAAHGHSSGAVNNCDAWANYGCSKWQDTRANCTDPNKGIMPWVAAPVRSAMYTLEAPGAGGAAGAAAGGRREYRAGEYLNVVLRARHADWKYRGLVPGLRLGTLNQQSLYTNIISYEESCVMTMSYDNVNVCTGCLRLSIQQSHARDDTLRTCIPYTCTPFMRQTLGASSVWRKCALPGCRTCW